MTATLGDFEKGTFTDGGTTRTFYRRGTGPAVIVCAEIPGITPAVAEFARKVAAHGLTAVVPSLFGDDGRPPTVPYMASTVARVCISKEFVMFARGKASPITVWLRALARREHEACGGPGVGVVGMCLTGGFALAMLVDDAVVAPVLSQPSLPAGPSRAGRRDLGISDAELARVKERAAEEGICVLGLRFTGDKLSPPERFERLREELGDNFIGVELDSAPGNAHGHRRVAHSVLTEDLDDRAGTLPRDALDRVLAFLGERLAG